jgi:hypothetical protein
MTEQLTAKRWWALFHTPLYEIGKTHGRLIWTQNGFRRKIGNNKYLEILPLLFGRARLHIGRIEPLFDGQYDDGW